MSIWRPLNPSVQTVKRLPAMQETWFDPLVRKIPCSRKWQPTPVFLAGESYGQRSLRGYSPWGCKQSDTTERLHSLTHATSGASLVAQRAKHLSAMWVQSLGQEDPLEKEMATHSSTLAWKIPWTEKPGGIAFLHYVKWKPLKAYWKENRIYTVLYRDYFASGC